MEGEDSTLEKNGLRFNPSWSLLPVAMEDVVQEEEEEEGICSIGSHLEDESREAEFYW